MSGLFFAVGSLVLIAGIVGVITGKLPKITGRKIPALFILAGFVLIMAAAAVPSTPPNPEAQIKTVLGTPKGDSDSGVVGLQYLPPNVTVDYHLYPSGLTSYPEEIGIELAPKVKQLFTKDASIEKLTFNVIFPYQDRYGNITWRPYCSFSITKQTYNRINWDNFASQDLLSVAEGVQYHR